jgi:serine protease AprX
MMAPIRHHRGLRYHRCAALVAFGLTATGLCFGNVSAAASSRVGVHGLDPGLSIHGRQVEAVVVSGGGTGGADVRAVGGRVTAPLPIVDGVAAEVPADRLSALASFADIHAITANRTVHLTDDSFDPSATASNFVRSTSSDAAWTAGDYGAGVGVAVLDTGVSPMPDFAGRLVHGPDLSGEGTVIDTFGHGTVMAGLIAGDGSDSATRNQGAYIGEAPAAHIVAVKVAGRNGAVDVSTMLQGMHWIAAYRDQFNIQVMNLSWGVPSTQDPALDPLNYAVERLWSLGIVVVVAAGNSGPYPMTIAKPADDPVVLTVGAYNDKGNNSTSDDAVTQFSSRGPTAFGAIKPDLVAPGRTVIATRSFGSSIEVNNPNALVWPSYIRGSGTSEAAAIASGAVALLRSARPDLTPDQVKDVLMSTANPMWGVSATSQGAGRINISAALLATPSAPPQVAPATGLGSLEASRGGVHVTANCDGVDTPIVGEMDVRCEQWDPVAWTTSDWTGDAWTGVTWKGSEWDGVTWKDVGWSDANWDGVTWKGGTWTSDSWQGGAWTGSGSATSAWTGVSWKDSTWSGVSWKDTAWTSNTWTSAEYDSDFMTAFWGSHTKPGLFIQGEDYTPRPNPRAHE